ncbi:hypothetical protein WT10_04480 [Burkholderia stagnalis]|nr:hypothetical protein WS59_06430 [Burkholderia stagnalis]KVN25451.1 hypothetical protein WT10_04480 [Burkholderia stagnalis]KWI68233.1 hypothetical protein WT75_21990 [Burkholderia stagnalis]KWK73943.1 hypothetical protein WT82_06030 [Burkholderia stagnalis]KWN16341.1 hypothetical protein WT84_19960 [Burkholderia stagnalis]
MPGQSLIKGRTQLFLIRRRIVRYPALKCISLEGCDTLLEYLARRILHRRRLPTDMLFKLLS